MLIAVAESEQGRGEEGKTARPYILVHAPKNIKKSHKNKGTTATAKTEQQSA